MTTLKALRTRKTSIQSTQKITVAMKMVAGAKLKRAQDQIEKGRPYAQLMHQMLRDLAEKTAAFEQPHPLLVGTGKKGTHLILLATSDRGLCGGFNTSLVKHTRHLIEDSQAKGEKVVLFCVGRRGKVMLERGAYKDLIIESFENVGYPKLSFSEAENIAESLIKMFQNGVFDRCTLVYNYFRSALRQDVTEHQLIPVFTEKPLQEGQALYEYEPDEETLLTQLLPFNVSAQIYRALLENIASEEGARMAAMESASRNAEEMIQDLTLTYNRTRQTHITRELIEIISGAEAL